MIDTFYVHLEFKAETGDWAINLPFVCTKCGVCCTLDDFLTAGEVKAKPQDCPDVHARLKALYDRLSEILEAGQVQYDDYVMHTRCPFLENKTCSIYQIRPEGCRQFPNTPFGMLTQDCEALTRLKQQCAALTIGRTTKKTYHFTSEPIKESKLASGQYENSIAKLHKVGITDDELTLLRTLNKEEKVSV